MRREELKDWTREQLEEEYCLLKTYVDAFNMSFDCGPAMTCELTYKGRRYNLNNILEQYNLSENQVSDDNKANQLENDSKELCALKEKMANLKMSPCDGDDFYISTPFGKTTVKQLISVEPYLRMMVHDVCTENDKLKSEQNDIESKIEQLNEENREMALKNKILNQRLEKLDKENTDLQNSHINLYNEKKDTIRQLKEENKSLKQRLQNMADVCDGSCFSAEEDDKDKLIADLQDQHQQDCIKINQLHVTIDTLVDRISILRNLST